MSIDIESIAEAGVRIGTVTWSKSPEGNNNEQQERDLTALINAAPTGVILDCSLVQIGNSELLNVLVRVRNYAKKRNKHIVLFNVPDKLREVIQLCKLGTVLPISKDAVVAKQLVYDLASGKGNRRLWLESHMGMAVAALLGTGITLGIVSYLVFR